ncbi:hypothetical protein EV426DRAFT_103427 [Tirmania nivea]|nr:hypothetical protein EV426DRAFT_103427 [Tirmania nivea]
MSGRHSYSSGPSDSHVLMNPPMPPSTTSSRSVNGQVGSGKAVASKNKVNSGGVAGRHSLGPASSVAPTPTPQQSHSSMPPNNHYHQRLMASDMVVENSPNPIMTNNNPNPPHYMQQHLQPPVHQNPPQTNTRKTKARTANIQGIITIESDPDDNAKNNMSKPQPASGPSLAGPASRNRSLLNGHYDPVRPNLASASPSISFLTDPQPTAPQPQPAVPISTYPRKAAEKSVAPPIIKPDIDSPPISASIKVATPTVAPTPQPVPEQPEKPAKADKPVKETTGQRSPKAAKTKKTSTAVSASVPKATGNGLLSGLPGADISGDNGDQIEIPTIYIHVPLNGETNKYVNFAKLAEEKYGAFAINPWAHRERMRLADTSGDEMMVDDSESESAMEERRMGGVDGGESTADNKPKKRTKRKQHDSYDSHDPFIDDSEMLYEEQAAATKDGFFVYSGPLIPQGEKVHVERADGTTSKRGRGGRARGSNRGAAAAKQPTTRKPRGSKKKEKEAEAERIRLEAVKQAS